MIIVIELINGLVYEEELINFSYREYKITGILSYIDSSLRIKNNIYKFKIYKFYDNIFAYISELYIHNGWSQLNNNYYNSL